MPDKFLWVEKYAPQTIDECILPTKLKEEFSQMSTLSNMLFVGEAGTGKTTVAKVLWDSLNIDVLFLNASLERSIDDVGCKSINSLTPQMENNSRILLSRGYLKYFQKKRFPLRKRTYLLWFLLLTCLTLLGETVFITSKESLPVAASTPHLSVK